MKDSRKFNFDIVSIYRKTDYNCYTQGFYFERRLINGAQQEVLIETCGKSGISRVQVVNFSTDGQFVSPIMATNYDPSLFAEGITAMDSNNYLALTWTERIMLIIDRATLTVG